MERVFIFPGAWQGVKNYGGYRGAEIWLKNRDARDIPVAEWYIGHSMGANFILAHHSSFKNGKFIFVNPLVRKRSIGVLVLRWMAFLLSEGIGKEKLVPARYWWHGVKMVWRLLHTDVWHIMQTIPRENLIVIRGRRDDYFCDRKSAEMMQNVGIRVIEVDAGHDWSDAIAEIVESCMAHRFNLVVSAEL